MENMETTILCTCSGKELILNRGGNRPVELPPIGSCNPTRSAQDSSRHRNIDRNTEFLNILIIQDQFPISRILLIWFLIGKFSIIIISFPIPKCVEITKSENKIETFRPLPPKVKAKIKTFRPAPPSKTSTYIFNTDVTEKQEINFFNIYSIDDVTICHSVQLDLLYP